MAKNNLFLGKARGKIGDVVLSILDGKQVSRARNRSPKNPKTYKQMYQRAIMASVMQMYAAGKMIFDHSFEGKTVKFGAMRRFMSVNARKLREAVLSDVETGVSTARIVSPGAVAPCPWEYRVSEGTYGKGAFGVHPDGPRLTANYESGDLVSDVLRLGDIYTFVMLYIDGTRGTAASLFSPPTKLGFLRLTVTSLPEGKTMSQAQWNEVFTIEAFNCVRDTAWEEGNLVTITYEQNFLPGEAYPAAMAVIRSRDDSGLRSTADFVCKTGLDWGIASGNILKVWGTEVEALGNSELILEGGTI